MLLLALFVNFIGSLLPEVAHKNILIANQLAVQKVGEFVYLKGHQFKFD
jgi:hypothetical protein